MGDRVLALKAPDKTETVFSTIFMWVFMGCIVLTVNGKLLESNM